MIFCEPENKKPIDINEVGTKKIVLRVLINAILDMQEVLVLDYCTL